MLTRVGILLFVWVFAVHAARAAGARGGTDTPEKVQASRAADTARELIQGSGVSAGLCVQLGVGDGSLAAELARVGGKFLVHGLDPDRETVATARRAIQARGAYGQASAETCALTQLPYVDNIVNLMVIEDLPGLLAKGLSLKEVARVLAPNGVACVRGAAPEELKRTLAAAGVPRYDVAAGPSGWVRLVKTRPPDMDVWTHFRHGPDGNMVSQDTSLAPVTSLRWADGPQFLWHNSGVDGWVSDNGRVFYIFSNFWPEFFAPPGQALYARDAYNGLLLWKLPLEATYDDRGKEKEVRYSRDNLVVAGDRLFTVLKRSGPVVMLDAATGAVLKTYEGSRRPRKILFHRGVLYLATGGRLTAIEPVTGRALWSWLGAPGGRNVVLSDDRAFSGGPGGVACLDLAGGVEKWSKAGDIKGSLLFHYRGALIFGEGYLGKSIHAYSAENGSHLWTFAGPMNRGGLYPEVLGVGGLVWIHAQVKAPPEKGPPTASVTAWVGLDPLSGRTMKRHDDPPEDWKVVDSGRHRCYEDRATERYFLHGNCDFVDVETGKYYRSRATRGTCHSGYMPANGLLYTSPFACRCLPWLRGFLALAPASSESGPARAVGERLERGPAFAAARPAGPEPDAWPTFRHDARRTGCATTSLPEDLGLLWETPVAKGSLTSPVVAEGMVFVSAGDSQQVCALDARTGQERWRYTLGSRASCPPTVYAGLCLVGCNDGWVYCLRSADGALSWRLRAAPDERRLVVRGRLESPWPVAGGVLVQDGMAYFAAGRHSDIDGGITVCAADPDTGKVLWERQVRSDGQKGEKNLGDVLVGNGKSLFMCELEFDPKTGQPTRNRGGDRLVSGVAGFLDSTWFRHKAQPAWSYGKTSGQMLVVAPDGTYGLNLFKMNTRSDEEAKKTPPVFKAGSWETLVPLRVRGLLVADKTVFAAGTTLFRQGEAGAAVWMLSAADGRKLREVRLGSIPADHGLAAAYGRLYVTTQDGAVLCLGKE